ncbi:hypothetical protein N7456_008182 [Penicillium angulare]|uniref:Zn(2)-C6 fungal-type domain-containing protein n=1 Tax=Penicillium angulare TaxID=116970 RepID=A0A9W9FC19_9EURO|nr:hypothetical protein N7456_008182 [Penicillium angulare]
MYEQPSRRACDRCHELKLRCHRSDEEKCSRCLRAGSSCVFSPSNRGRRPAHHNLPSGPQISNRTTEKPSHVKIAPQMPHNTSMRDTDAQNKLKKLENIQLEITGTESLYTGDLHPQIISREDFTPSLNSSGAQLEPGSLAPYSSHVESSLSPTINNPDMTFLESFSDLSMPQALAREALTGFNISQFQSQQSNPSQGSGFHPKISPQTQFLQHFMKDLLELDIELIHHALEDPVLMDTASTNLEANNNNTSLSSTACAVDTTFNLTQRFIKILCRAGSHTPQFDTTQTQSSYCQPHISTTSSFSSRFQQFTAKPASQEVSGSSIIACSEKQEVALDQMSLLHALSTYMRLIDVYHTTFSQTTEKFGVALAYGSKIPLPSLQIGTFAMDNPVAHIKLVIQSALQLLDRLGDLVNNLTSPFFGGENAGIDLSQTPSPSIRYNEHNGIRAMMVTVRECENQLMQAAARLQNCCHEAQESHV